MSTLGDLNIRIGAEIDGFEAAMRQVQQGIGRVGDYAKQAGQALTTYVTLPLGLLGGAAIAAAAKVDSLTRGLQAVTQQQLGEQGVTGLQGIAQAATDTQARLKELREVAKLPGLGFTEAIQGDIRLRAVGLSADLSKKALLAFGNAIATTGGGKSELDRVTVQLGQLSAKGKVLAQDLRPIIEAAPAVATALKKLYGTVDSETISASLAKQGKSSTDFIAVLTDELGKLPKVTGGLAIAGENISDSLTLAGSKIGLTAEKLFDLSGIANRAGEFIEGLADKFAGLDPSTQKLIFGLAAGAAAVGPLLFAFGAVAAAIPSVVAGLEVLGLASTAALGPIGLGAAAIAAAAALIITNWDALSSYFSSGEGGRVFGDLADAALDAGKTVIGAIGDIVSAYLSFTSLVAGGASSAGGGKAFAFLVDNLTGALGAFSASIKLTSALLKGDLNGAFAAAEQGGRSLFKPYTELLGLNDELQKGFEGAAGGGGRFGTSLLQLSGVLTGFNQQLQGFAGGLPAYGTALNSQSGLLVRLHEQLKQLKEDQQNAGTEKAALAFNPLIDNLEKYIARLEGSSASTKKLQKDIKALADSAMGFRVADVVEAAFKVPEFKLEGLLGKAKNNDPEELLGTLPDYDKLFSDSAKLILDAGGQIPDAIRAVSRDALQAQLDFNTGSAELLAAFPLDGFKAIGSGIGDAIANGGSVLESAGKALIEVLASYAEKKATLLIALGTADIVVPGLQGLGAAEIAGGIALLAAAGVARGAGASIGRSAGAGSSLASQPRSSSIGNSVGTQQQPLVVRVTGELTGRAGALVAIIRGEDYRELRTR